jgi:epoxyqueuosine reductase
MPRDIKQLQQLAKNSSINLIGIATADWSPLESRLDADYRQWLAEGRQGSMAYLKGHLESKYHPQKMLEGAKSLVVCGLNYYQEAPWENGLLLSLKRGTDPQKAESSGRIARYAWGRDYHKGFKKDLQKLAAWLAQGTGGKSYQTRAVVDSSPLHERLAADAAGFAFTAKNTLVINHELGSWFFIGVILTTEELVPTGRLTIPGDRPHHPQGQCPSGCHRCAKVCPTGALDTAYKIDASRCISYLTIEHKGSIDPELRPLMGDWLFGCDLCQEVCPFNKGARETDYQDFRAHRAGGILDLQKLLAMRDKASFLERFAGSPVMRAGRELMVRNACVAAGNRGDRALVPALEAVIEEDTELCAEHAQWAIDRILEN